MPRKQRWSDEELVAAATNARNLIDVCRALGLEPGGGTYKTLRRHMLRLEVHAPLIQDPVTGKARIVRRFTDDELREAVAESSTMSEVARRVGYDASGGIHRYLVKHIARLHLNTRHFKGQGWARGTRRPRRPTRPLEDMLVRGAVVNNGNLRRRLIRAGLKPAHCERCGLAEWQGAPLPLALDHVNGDHTDNRLENLRVLCPNCHAVTDTWCGRNNRRRSPMGRRHGS